MLHFPTVLKSALYLACGLLLSIASTARAVTITLNADGSNFNAELLTGSSNVGVIFYHGRGQSPTGDVVNQLRNNLNSQGYTTLSLSDPVPTSGTSFSDYDSEESSINPQVFDRLDAALTEMANEGVQHVVLSGFSLGSRFMTAAAAAWQAGVYTPSTNNIDLLGLVGAGMYSSFSLSSPTAGNPTSLSDFNVLDTNSNLVFIHSIPVLDLFGSNDTQAVDNAGIRSAAYGGDPSQYVQTQLECPPNDGTYYAKVGSNAFQPYYQYGDKRCHQLRDGWTLDSSGNYVDSFHVRTNGQAPLQSAVDGFFNQYIVPQVSAPEPGGLSLLLIGLLLLLTGTRRKLQLP